MALRKKKETILICSRGGSLCRKLIQRLNKEKYPVYLLTGSEMHSRQEKTAAFQEYYFSYQSESIDRIILNVSPDLVLVMGAFDPLYVWGRNEHESVRFLSNLACILDASVHVKVPEMLFLSMLDESAVTKARKDIRTREEAVWDEKCKALARAESLLETYSGSELQISILRLPVVFGGYEDNDGANVCQRLTISYLWDQELSYTFGKAHLCIYDSDAAEAILRVIEKRKRDRLYQVKGIPFQEQELAEILLSSELVDRESVTIREDMSERNQIPFFPSQLESELHMEMKYSLEQGITLLLKVCRKIRDRDNRKKKSLPWREWLLPFFESIGLFLVALLITFLIRDTWVGEHLDLFLLYSMFIGLTWGTAHALLATLLSLGAKVLLVLGIENNLSQHLDKGFFVGFLQVLIVGVASGYMRDKYRRKSENLQDERNYFSNEVRDLIQINDSSVYVNHLLEKRLTSYNNSLGRVYEITNQLDFMEPRKVLFHAVKVVSELMETEDVAIYISGNNQQFFRLAAAGSQYAEAMGKSIRYDKNSFLYLSLSQREVYQNRKMDDRYPTFAGAVYHQDVPRVLVLVWMNSLDSVNLYNSNMLAILCRILEGAVRHAVVYEEMIYEDAHIPGTRILKEEKFCQVLDTFEEGKNLGVLQYILLKVVLNGHKTWEVESLVRETDALGILEKRLYLLLSSSNMDVVPVVRARFNEKGMNLIVSKWPKKDFVSKGYSKKEVE